MKILILDNNQAIKQGYVVTSFGNVEGIPATERAKSLFPDASIVDVESEYDIAIYEKMDQEIIDQEKRRQREIDKVEFPKLREKKLIQLLGDQVEIEDEREEKAFAEVYPDWEIGRDYAVNDRVTYNGKIVKVIQAHTSQADWTPDVSTSLFSYLRPESEEIPLWSDFQSHEFQNLEVGTKVTDAGVTYELTDPAQGHRQPSGADGHFGWIEVQ